MKKIFISVNVPAVSKIYDFKISPKMKIKDAILLMYQIIGEDFQGILKDINNADMFMLSCNIILKKDLRLLDYEIRDEEKFVLL